MSCEHAVLKLKGVPGPATLLVCAECGIRAESVVEVLYGRWKQAEADAEARKLCTRCGSKYDGTGACSNKPCQGGRGEWCLEHHGAPFAYGVTRIYPVGLAGCGHVERPGVCETCARTTAQGG